MSIEITLDRSRAAETASLRRWVWWILAGMECVLALWMVGDWLIANTRYLYLDKRIAPKAVSLARQQFEVQAGRIEPRIVAPSRERLAFPIVLSRPSELRVTAVPSTEATIEIAIAEGASRRTLLQRTLVRATEIVLPLVSSGTLELATEGDLEWRNPRVVEKSRLGPILAGWVALLALSLAWARREPPLERPLRPRARSVLLGGLTAVVSASLCLGLLEAGLRGLGQNLPPWIAAERRNLGEVRPDPRWRETARFGPRLAAGLHTTCQWQSGDIVRMGFIPPDLVPHPVYRYPFVTDAEGFRNAGLPEGAPGVAALGDSFTDGMTLPAELTWPARLESHLGESVRNYGTAGFGPEQELRVLQDYVLPRRPRRVVVGFFAGNDVQDAELFERFQRDGGPFPSGGLGWRFKDEVTHFDQLYLASLYQGAKGLIGGRERPPAAVLDPGNGNFSGEDANAPAVAQARFDRGLFTVPVAGRTLRFAFLPPYLNSARRSRAEIEASRGWELTRRAYREMARLVRGQGGELVVLFIPSKTQVYLPLLEASFPRAELEEAIRLCFRNQPYGARLADIERNREALDDLMSELCREDGIAFLDLTAELRAKVEAGYNVYFPDDSHWNALGHETAAAALARVLEARGD
jgi:hypothetical protein